MFQLCACHSDTPQYNSSETFRNVPLLLSHVCLCAVRFDGYLFAMRGTRGAGLQVSYTPTQFLLLFASVLREPFL